MTELSALIQNEYKDITLDISASQIISAYKKRRARAYSFATVAAVCVIAVLSVINLNTGIITEVLRTTGDFLMGHHSNDDVRKIEYSESAPAVMPTSPSPTAEAANPAATKESAAAQITTEPRLAENADETAEPGKTEEQSATENTVSSAEKATEPESSPINEFKYVCISDSDAAITGYSGDETRVVIPKTIDGYEVSEIGEGAFEGFKGDSVVFPDSVISVDAEAFKNAAELRKVTLSKKIRMIDNAAFSGCKALEEIDLHNVRYIGEYAFKGCVSLISLEVPASAEVIGYKAFADCTGLRALVLNAEYTKDENNVFGNSGRTFSGCKSLETLTVGNGVRTIQTESFSDCVSLKSVTLPRSLRTIGVSSFSGCKSIESIQIPAGVTAIGKLAFYKCVSLGEVGFPNTLKSIGEKAFLHCKALTGVSLSGETVTMMDMCLGYYELISRGVTYYKKVSGFTVSGFENTVAKNYAKRNGFKFESLGEQPEPTTLNLETYIVTLNAGETYTVVYSVENPIGETTFSSSAPGVAAVSSNGRVRAVSEGTAKITVTNNGVSRKLIVIVGLEESNEND